MLEVYGISNCDTVKKSLQWLTEHDVSFRFHDFKKEGLTEKKLEEWIDKAGLDIIINKKSTTYRNLPAELQKKIAYKKEAIKVMVEQTSIIKRPVIEHDKGLQIGFNETTYLKLISS